MQNVISGAQSLLVDPTVDSEILTVVPLSAPPLSNPIPFAQNPFGPGTPAPTAQFFMDLTLAWLEAWKVRDVEKLGKSVAEEFCFVSRRVKGMCTGKTGWLRMVTEQYTLEDYEADFITVNVQEYTAIVVYRLALLTRPNFNNLAEKYVITDTWTLIDQHWQAVSRQPMSL